MNTQKNHIVELSQNVKRALEDDIVSYGELKQLVGVGAGGMADTYFLMDAVIGHLLSEDVQIGYAFDDGGEYVKFKTWNGTISERIKRARREVEAASEYDRNSAFWLCFSSNVDEFEE